MALSRQHKVPVRWNESRSENAQATIQGRGQIQHIDLAADADGKLTALRVRLVGDMGAYLQLVTPGHPAARGVPLRRRVRPAGGLRLRVHIGVHDDDADRRLPRRRPSGGDVRHRADDGHARRADRGSIRWSFAGATSSPPTSTRTRPGAVSSTTPATTTRRRRWPPSWSATTRCGRDSGRRTSTGATKRLGIGVSSYFEMCGLAPSRVLASLNYSAGGWEAATVRVLPTSKVQVVTGTAPHGQGHETAWSMIVAEKLGISPDDVDVLHSDTAIAPLGLDTYGSRSLPVGGVAIAMACDKVIDKAKQIAAHQLEANADDLEYAGGRVPGEGLAGQDDAARRDRVRGVHGAQPPRRPRAEPRGARHVRPAELLVAVRHAHLRRRGRHRDRRTSTCCSTSPSTTAACRSTR